MSASIQHGIISLSCLIPQLCYLDWGCHQIVLNFLHTSLRWRWHSAHAHFITFFLKNQGGTEHPFLKDANIFKPSSLYLLSFVKTLAFIFVVCGRSCSQFSSFCQQDVDLMLLSLSRLMSPFAFRHLFCLNNNDHISHEYC